MSGIGSSKPVCNDDATSASGRTRNPSAVPMNSNATSHWAAVFQPVTTFRVAKPQRQNQTRRQHEPNPPPVFRAAIAEFRQQAAAGRRQHGDQDVVFDHLAVAVLVHGHPLGVFSATPSQPADELMQRAEWTDPAAEKPSQQNCESHSCQRPKQSGVYRLGGEQRAEGHERIELEQPVDRPAAQLPPAVADGGDHAKPDEQREEKNLRDAPDGDDFHRRASFFFRRDELRESPNFSRSRLFGASCNLALRILR